MYLFDPLALPEVDDDGFPLDPEADIIVATDLHANEGAISKDGSTVAIGTGEGFVIADAVTGETRIGPLDVGGPVDNVEFSPDERLIAVGVLGQGVTVIEVATGNQVAHFDGINRYINWSIDGSTLRAIDVDAGSLVWDATGKPPGEVWSRDLGDVLVTAIAAGKDDVAVLTRENPSLPGSLFVLDSRSGDVSQEHQGRWGYGVMFTSDGSEVLAQPGDVDDSSSWIGPFEALSDQGDVMTTYRAPCPDFYQSDCAEDPDSFWLFSTSAAMSPDGAMFAAGYHAMAVWDVAEGTHLATSQEFGFALVIGFSAEGEVILWRQRPDETFELAWYDPHTFEPLRAVRTGEIYGISSGGSLVISWANDKYGVASDDPGVQVHTLRDGHTGEIVGSIETDLGGRPFFSPSGDRFGIFDFDREITIWSTETLTMEQTIPLAAQYDEAVWLDETTIAMMYPNGAIVALTTDTQELISAARSKVTRTLTSVECRDFDIDPCPTLEEIRTG